MAKKTAPVIPPNCAHCSCAARLTDGREIYPHRPDLHAKKVWVCDGCGSYVGCHGNTDRPLGTPANFALRKARMALHEQMIDPLWMEAWRDPIYAGSTAPQAQVTGAARNRVYAYLAHHMKRTQAETHTAMFDVETCRAAWRVLNGVKYADIRTWAKSQKTKVPA